jgi:hypothetical protein
MMSAFVPIGATIIGMGYFTTRNDRCRQMIKKCETYAGMTREPDALGLLTPVPAPLDRVSRHLVQAQVGSGTPVVHLQHRCGHAGYALQRGCWVPPPTCRVHRRCRCRQSLGTVRWNRYTTTTTIITRSRREVQPQDFGDITRTPSEDEVGSVSGTWSLSHSLDTAPLRSPRSGSTHNTCLHFWLHHTRSIILAHIDFWYKLHKLLGHYINVPPGHAASSDQRHTPDLLDIGERRILVLAIQLLDVSFGPLALRLCSDIISFVVMAEMLIILSTREFHGLDFGLVTLGSHARTET